MTSLDAPGSPDNDSGSPDYKPESANNKTGSADNKLGSTSQRQRHTWEHFKSLLGSLGNMPSLLEMLLVHLEIKATTYHSTIFKTHIFILYSHL